MARFVLYGNFSKLEEDNLTKEIKRNFSKRLERGLDPRFIDKEIHMRNPILVEFFYQEVREKACFIVESEEIIKLFNFYFLSAKKILNEVEEIIIELCRGVFTVKEINMIGQVGKNGSMEIYFFVY